MELSALEVTSGAPHLKYLHMELRSPLKKYLDLPKRWSPKIQHVNLAGVGLCGWNDCLLVGLRTLVLHDVQPLGPSPKELLEILKWCPDLEELSLGRIQCRCNDDSIETSKIPLLHLQSIALFDIDLITTNALLAGIHAPLCYSFICCHQSDQLLDAVDTQQTRSFFISRIKHHLPITETIEIATLVGNNILIDLYNDIDCFLPVAHILLDLLTPIDVLSCLYDILDSVQPPWPHSIMFNFMFNIVPEVGAFLGNSRRIHHITFRSFDGEDLCTILRDLSEAREDAGHDEHSKWLFPALQDISILNHGPYDLAVANVLRLVVERRGGNARKLAAEGGGDGLALLKSISVSKEYGLDHETWATIADILGDGARIVGH
ncbi:hypothetical protein FRB94_001244 [Tulasnella sp. JGI-2019a]|nr:hypothetical protein FRB94_001244 [Tulasnella sp. JGI-2019a]